MFLCVSTIVFYVVWRCCFCRFRSRCKIFAAIYTLSFKNVIAVPAAYAKIDCGNSCWDVGFCGRRHIFFSVFSTSCDFAFRGRRKESFTFSSLSWYCRMRGSRSVWCGAVEKYWRRIQEEWKSVREECWREVLRTNLMLEKFLTVSKNDSPRADELE